jgi:hypothetical protein
MLKMVVETLVMMQTLTLVMIQQKALLSRTLH